MRELVRGAIRLHVLHHAAEGPVNGAWMAAELARHGYEISPGTLYPTLHRMEEQGLLRSGRAVVDGRSVRRYEITPLGRAELVDGRRTLQELADEVLGRDGGWASGREGRRASGRDGGWDGRRDDVGGGPLDPP